MNSPFALLKPSPFISHDFPQSRIPVLQTISLVAFLVRLMTLFCSVLSQLTHLQTYHMEFWLIRTISVAWHLSVLLACRIHPFLLYHWFSLLLLPTYLTNFILLTHNLSTLTDTLLAAFVLFLLIITFLSTSWHHTSLAMISSSISVILFSVLLHHQIYDLTFHSVIFALGGLSTMACYYLEKALKI